MTRAVAKVHATHNDLSLSLPNKGLVSDRPYSKKADKVLEEEVFVAKLDSLIRREFFPDLAGSGEDRAGGGSVDGFLAGHTSEDNAAYSAQVKVAEQSLLRQNLVAAQERVRDLALLGPAAGAAGAGTGGETWRYLGKNALMFNPEGISMPPPPPRPAGPRVVPENTRFASAVGQPRRYLLKSPSLSASESGSVFADAVGQEEAGPARARIAVAPVGQGRPAQPEFGYAPSPSLNPEQVPIMTWGEVDATPVVLSGRTFQMQEPSARERAGWGLMEKAAAHRNPASGGSRKRARDEPRGGLSPAALAFAAKRTPRREDLTSELRRAYGGAGGATRMTPTLASAITPRIEHPGGETGGGGNAVAAAPKLNLKGLF